MPEPHSLEERGWPDHLVKDLVARAQCGERAARDRVVEANLRLVRSLAGRFSSSGTDPEDLFQLGCIGLLKAVDRFDLTYDVRFSTYAVPLILGEIRRHLRDDGLVRVSRSLKQLAYQARKAREKLLGELGRDPTVAEIAREIGVEPEVVVQALDGARPPTSIHQTIHESDGEPIYLLDQLASQDSNREGQWLDRVALRDSLAQLDPQEEQVIMLRFFRDKTQTEVASILGCSQVQVSRLERRALKQIRRFMSAS